MKYYFREKSSKCIILYIRILQIQLNDDTISKNKKRAIYVAKSLFIKDERKGHLT